MIPQNLQTGLNNKLDPGDLAAVWFDLQNTATDTAGGVLLKISSLDPGVKFSRFNVGLVDSQNTQIRYGKVNGTKIVCDLTTKDGSSCVTPAAAAYAVPTGNSYFKTNPSYGRSYATAVFVEVSPTLAHGTTVQFQVQAIPSNGSATTVTFNAVIH